MKPSARTTGLGSTRGCATIRTMELATRRWFGPLSAAALLTTALSGQTDWEDRSTNADPRWGHALTFDLLRGRTVLFGGETGVSTLHLLADTWEWDGTGWTHSAPANTPPARSSDRKSVV